MNIERPLDLLNQSKGKEVLIKLKNGKQIVGKLLAFDININVVLENAKEIIDSEMKTGLGLTFIRGDSIVYISPSL
jgi:small nuclear ribonucleoprotein